jgi:hypothetical protein
MIMLKAFICIKDEISVAFGASFNNLFKLDRVGGQYEGVPHYEDGNC